MSIDYNNIQFLLVQIMEYRAMGWVTSDSDVSINDKKGRCSIKVHADYKKIGRGKGAVKTNGGRINLMIKMTSAELLYRMGSGDFYLSIPVATDEQYKEATELTFRLQHLAAEQLFLIADYVDFEAAEIVIGKAKNSDEWTVETRNASGSSAADENASIRVELDRYTVSFNVNQYGRRFEIINLKNYKGLSIPESSYGLNFQSVTNYDNSKSLAENCGECVASGKIALQEWLQNVDFIKRFAIYIMK